VVVLGVECVCEPVPVEALLRAASMAGPAGTVCVTGSLYLVADILRAWRGGARVRTPWNVPPH